MNRATLAGAALLVLSGTAQGAPRSPPGAAQAAPLSPREALCASNPAFSPAMMSAVVAAELQKDHDPALDSVTPEKLAADASAQGVSECASELAKNQATYEALKSLSPANLVVGWEAYNVACADHTASKGDCIHVEVAAATALKHMISSNQPPGARAIAQTCELVMKTNPANGEWRACVDEGLSVHASEAAARSCKTSVSWHIAATGAQAAAAVVQCLKAATKN